MKLPKVSAGVGRFGVHLTVEEKNAMLPSWPSISIPTPHISIPHIPLPTIPIPGRHDSPQGAQAEKFIKCMGFPNKEEAATCMAALPACTAMAAGGPLPYGACVGAACAGAGAAHTYRCAVEAGIISGGSSGGIRNPFGNLRLPRLRF